MRVIAGSQSCPLYGATSNSVTSSDLSATTITTSIGNAGVDCETISPDNNSIAHLVVDSKGSLFVECLFDMNSSASQANALIGVLRGR